MKCHLCKSRACATEGRDCHAGRLTEISDTFFNAGLIEAKYYNEYNRFQELIEYCRLNEINNIGIAFCTGLHNEAETFCGMLTGFGLAVVSVCCKIGGIDKNEFNIPKINEGKFEAICNPYFQAEVLNSAKTELNIIFGLCMGHDIEFSKNSIAPVTTFLVKDRVLGHNPAACVYSRYIQNKIRADL